MSTILQLIESNKQSMLSTGCEETVQTLDYDSSAPSPF